MCPRTLCFTALFVISLWLAAAAHPSSRQDNPFSFQRGQTVFLAVFFTSGQPNEHVTGRLRKAFEKEKVFTPTDDLAAANFVFVAYSSDGFLSGFALTPEQYRQARGNLDALRAAALWQGQESEGNSRTLPEPLSGRLAKRFHREALTNNPPASPPVAAANAASARAIFIAAYRAAGQPDLSMEERIKKGFEKLKVFTFTTNPAQAEFVFVAYSAYDERHLNSLIGFAFAPDQYEQTKGDIDAMHEAALWRDQELTGTWRHSPERLSPKLIERFHQHINSPQPPSQSQTPPQTSAESDAFTLQAGQLVFPIAYRVDGRPDFLLTGKLREAFAQEPMFKLADKASQAQFVFLVNAEFVPYGDTTVFGYLSQEVLKEAFGFALSPESYKKAKGNPDALRQSALWMKHVKGGFSTGSPRGLSNRLIKDFQTDVRNGLKPQTIASLDATPPKTESAAVAGSAAPTVLPRDLKEAQKFDREAAEAFEKGDAKKAAARAQGSLEFKERELGAEHQELIVSLNLLATAATARHDYKQAEQLLARALTLGEKQASAASPTPLALAETLNNFAALHLEKGDFARAEAAQQRALSLLEKSAGPADLSLAAPLNNLALIELNKNNSDRAEELLKRALAIQEKKLGGGKRETARTLHNLATLYFTRGDDARAEPLYLRTLEIIGGKALAIGRFFAATDRILSFGMSKEQRERKQAENEMMLYLLPVFLPNNSPYLPDTLNNLAIIRIRQGRSREANDLLERALWLEERAYGVNHPDLARTYDGFSLLHRASGDIYKALEAKQRANEIVENSLRRNLTAGSERQKLAYLARFAEQTDLALSLHWLDAPNDVRVARAAVTTLLRQKTRGLDAMADVVARLRLNADAPSRALLDRLTEARAQLAALTLDGYTAETAASYPQRAQQLTDEIERIEAQISERSAEFRSQLYAITLETVQAAIPEGMALVEFARYSPAEAKQRGRGQPRYVAYVIPAKGQLRWVELGSAAELERAVFEWRAALREKSPTARALARALDEKLMRPVRQLLATTRAVLLAPDGALNLIPFAALVDEEDRYLVEQYSFTYLSSGRDLLRLQHRAPNRRETILFANPDFGERRATAEPAAGEPAGFDFSRLVFTPLPGTAEEGRALSELLPDARLFTQSEATETALKQMAAPNLLHIATHGFFFDRDASPADGAAGQRLLLQQSVSGKAVSVGRLSENPLLRAGLGLAGANARRGGDDDGILTAFEVAALNLWGTRLVALSACDTGVGEVKSGQGVFGLRRALALAGAETQVMSLWPVSDQGTRDLMIEYYKALQAGEGRGAAMRQVQLKMLSDQQRQHPYFWASFIVSGEWANLDGRR